MKKIVSILLILIMITASTSMCFAYSQNKVLTTVKAMGIMVGDANGNMNTDANLTRAQFAKMLVAASTQSGSSSEKGTGFSMFKDVSKTYWAGDYIYKVARNGWMSGYSDSTFRPANNVKLEEACAAVIRLLGYKPADLSGSYPMAYLNKADDLGLLDNVKSVKGQYITRMDCANIFYNALLAQTSNGQTYGTAIGCKISGDSVSYTASSDTNNDGIYVGIITAKEKSASSSSSSGVETTVTVTCTDGSSRSFALDSSVSYDTGKLVQVNVSNGESSLSSVSKGGSFSGKVNAKGTQLGDYAIADDVQILDADDYGNAENVGIESIKGMTLSSGDVRYYSFNSSGEIAVLILDDVTGELWDTVYMTSAENSGSSVSVSGSYTYIRDGKTQSLRTSDKAFSVSVGGTWVKFDASGTAQSMKNLSSVELTTITSSVASSKTAQYKVSDEVQIYIRNGSEYILSDITAVSGGDYKLTAWYTPQSANSNITLVIAEK